MDENNIDNNQDTSNKDAGEKMTMPLVKNVDSKLFVTVVVLVIFMVSIVITMLGKMQTSEQPDDVVVSVVPELVTSVIETGPEKISAGEALPEGFPEELLLETNAKITNGYSINYGDLTQLTASFDSTKTLTENYETYEKFLNDKLWIILNKNQTKSLSAIYAMRRGEEINLVIEKTDDTSRVSISLLKN